MKNKSHIQQKLYDENFEKWHEIFDAVEPKIKEPDYTIINITAIAAALSIIIAFHCL